MQKKTFTLKKLGAYTVPLLLAAAPAYCQLFQLSGQGGSQLSAFAHTVVGAANYICLTGIVLMGSVVGWKLTHDQRGWEHVKNWVFGLIFFAVVEGLAAYITYAAQNSGLNTQGTLF